MSVFALLFVCLAVVCDFFYNDRMGKLLDSLVG